MHHEHQLYALQQAKKSFSSATPGGTSSSTDKSGPVCPDVETAIKAQQEQLFNKKLKQYSSKVFTLSCLFEELFLFIPDGLWNKFFLLWYVRQFEVIYPRELLTKMFGFTKLKIKLLLSQTVPILT